MPKVQVDIVAKDEGSAAVKNFGRAVEGVNDGIKGAQASWQKYTFAIGAAVGVMAGAVGAAKALGAALNEGAQLELAQSRFENLAASIGTTADALTGDMARATQGMISDAQLVASASDMISLGLADSGDEVVRLSNLVGQLGWDMQVLTLTMANDSMLRLDALGLSMTDVKARMEDLKAAGVAADEAFDLAVIEAGEAKLELLGSAADTTAGKIQQLTTIWTNATDAFKVEFAEGVSEGLGQIAGHADLLGEAAERASGRWAYMFGSSAGTVAGVWAVRAGTKALAEDLNALGGPSQEFLTYLEELQAAQPKTIINTDPRELENELQLYAAIRAEVIALQNAEEERQRRARAAASPTGRERWEGPIPTRDERVALIEVESTYRDITGQYWEMAEGARVYIDSVARFEYGQYVIEQQAAAVENLAARHEAYQAQLVQYQTAMAAGGDFFMAQAQADPLDQIFNDDMTTNADALNNLIIGIADNAGVGAVGLADLNIQLGEMEPAAARAMVAATVAQQAIELLIGAWQGGEIDTSQLMGSIDAVIAELQNKTLPEIEIGIKAKLDMGEGLDIPHGERRWMEKMGESPVIPIEANLTPFEAALAQALGQVAGSPAEGRTLQILADYEAVTTAATTGIPAAIQGISADARTITFIPDDKEVQAVITALDQKHISVYVDYIPSGTPPVEQRAAGGPVSGNTPYIVGEVGPELFIPWTSGAIVPNHRVAQEGGGGINMTLNFYGPTTTADVRRAADDAGRRLLERVRRAGVPT